jgi:hypothetical protein
MPFYVLLSTQALTPIQEIGVCGLVKYLSPSVADYLKARLNSYRFYYQQFMVYTRLPTGTVGLLQQQGSKRWTH